MVVTEALVESVVREEKVDDEHGDAFAEGETLACALVVAVHALDGDGSVLEE